MAPKGPLLERRLRELNMAGFCFSTFVLRLQSKNLKKYSELRFCCCEIRKCSLLLLKKRSSSKGAQEDSHQKCHQRPKKDRFLELLRKYEELWTKLIIICFRNNWISKKRQMGKILGARAGKCIEELSKFVSGTVKRQSTTDAGYKRSACHCRLNWGFHFYYYYFFILFI